MRPLFGGQALCLRLINVAGLVTRFQTADDRNDPVCTKSARQPSQRAHTQARTVIRHAAARRLDQSRPALGVTFLVLREFFKDYRPLLILLGGGHRTVERDPVHFDEIVLLIARNVRLGGILRFHTL
jgi:hypothetical protein